MMKKEIKIACEQLSNDPFTLIGKQWMLVTAMKDKTVNTMTASWGGLGILWNKKVAFVFIRTQRYTKDFVDNSEYLTLSFYDESKRDALTYLGTKSGKDGNKIKAVDFHPIINGNYAYFEEAHTVIKCKKLYAQELDEKCFMSNKIPKEVYPSDDFHTMYIVEIAEVINLI